MSVPKELTDLHLDPLDVPCWEMAACSQVRLDEGGPLCVLFAVCPSNSHADIFIVQGRCRLDPEDLYFLGASTRGTIQVHH